MQIPIINGIYTDINSDFRTSYPINLVPVPKENGISQGYLRPADGVDLFATGQGVDRGAINWDGLMYRASGSKLIRVNSNGTVDVIGEIGNDNLPVTFDYSFDYLAVASNNDLFLYDGVTLTQVTDVDLGNVLDFVWIDGYFVTTDGSFLVVTELNDPFAVSPLKYGSSEVSPDPIIAVLKLRNEVYAVNRYSIEVFANVGGDLFPFQRINGALIERGAIGNKACAVFMDSIAFVGSAQKESIGVYLGVNGQSQKISTREIDQVLASYTDTQLSTILVETRAIDSHNFLYIHLPDRTFVFDGNATSVMQQPIWFVLKTDTKYKLRHFIYCYSDWYCGDSDTSKVGKIASSHSRYYGANTDWEFATQIAYNESNGAMIHEIELVALTGNTASASSTISTSYSVDGQTWSIDKSRASGGAGQRNKRLAWFNQGFFRNWRIQRFKGNSDSHLSIARLEAQVEGLAV